MVFQRLVVMPLVALLITGFIAAASASDETPETTIPQEESENDAVSKELTEGEMALQRLLGPEVKTLDSLLKPMIDEMATSYGVSKKELAVVAKEVMQKIAEMDTQTLQATLAQLAGLNGLDWGNSGSLQELFGSIGSSGIGVDEI